MGLANIAATYMEHLVDCQKHGYSQSERWGVASRGSCFVSCEGHTGEFYHGDRDCSSAVCDAWQTALQGTPYEGVLNGATYTGNMKSVFLASGLFEWKPMSFSAQRGDIYLNERNHTAMCLDGSPSNDILGEFCISENGTIYGNWGDQTGGESRRAGYYNYPWDGILHYNGKADGATPSVKQPKYRVWTREHGWHPWMEGLKDLGGSSDDFAGTPGCAIYQFQPENFKGDYRIVRADGSETINEQGNINSPIVGIELPDPYVYRVHWLGDNPAWGKWEHGEADNGAGKDASSPLDMISIKVE